MGSVSDIWRNFGELSDEDKAEYMEIIKKQTEKNARALFLLGRAATRRATKLEKQLEESAQQRDNVTKFGR